MDENVKWLIEHKFEFCQERNEWTRNLDIDGNFKIDGTDETKFEKRKIQRLTIILNFIDNGDVKGWVARLLIRNGHDLDNKEDQIFVSARNENCFLSETPKEAINMTANDFGKMLISCLKQVAKLASKVLTISFEYKEEN